MRIKLDDIVVVIAGDDKGVRGKVLRVDHEAGKVVVEGVNRVYKHVRKSQKNPQGGRLSKEMPIHISNVMLVSEEIQRMAVDRRPSDEIKKIAIEQGMKTLRQDGLDKVLLGRTSLEEVMRVVA